MCVLGWVTQSYTKNRRQCENKTEKTYLRTYTLQVWGLSKPGSWRDTTCVDNSSAELNVCSFHGFKFTAIFLVAWKCDKNHENAKAMTPIFNLDNVLSYSIRATHFKFVTMTHHSSELHTPAHATLHSDTMSTMPNWQHTANHLRTKEPWWMCQSRVYFHHL